jgi:hypothetical protein
MLDHDVVIIRGELLQCLNILAMLRRQNLILAFAEQTEMRIKK